MVIFKTLVYEKKKMLTNAYTRFILQNQWTPCLAQTYKFLFVYLYFIIRSTWKQSRLRLIENTRALLNYVKSTSQRIIIWNKNDFIKNLINKEFSSVRFVYYHIRRRVLCVPRLLLYMLKLTRARQKWGRFPRRNLLHVRTSI